MLAPFEDREGWGSLGCGNAKVGQPPTIGSFGALPIERGPAVRVFSGFPNCKGITSKGRDYNLSDGQIRLGVRGAGTLATRLTYLQEEIVKVKVVNHFWVAGDILVYTQTGAAQEVFRLVNNARDASAFGRGTAENVREFFGRRANLISKAFPISFSVIPSESPNQGLWVVYGKQEAEVDSES